MISIILPTHNRERFIPAALEMCLSQTYRNIELIVVDDASVDGTVEIVRAYTDKRICYIRQDCRRGLAAALNTGFSRAKGAFLTWVPDDDRYEPEAMAVMAETLKVEPQTDFVYARYRNIDFNDQVLGEGRVEEPSFLDRDNYVGGCFLYRRCVCEKLGGYALSAFLVEDYEYFLRVRAAGFRMKMIDNFLFSRRLHPDSLTCRYSVREVQSAVARVRRPYIRLFFHFFLLGEAFYHAGFKDKTVRYVILALILNPGYRPSWRLLALASLPKGVIVRIRLFLVLKG